MPISWLYCLPSVVFCLADFLPDQETISPSTQWVEKEDPHLRAVGYTLFKMHYSTFSSCNSSIFFKEKNCGFQLVYSFTVILFLLSIFWRVKIYLKLIFYLAYLKKWINLKMHIETYSRFWRFIFFKLQVKKTKTILSKSK